MKIELATFTLNSSTAFQVAPAKLGWDAMPVYCSPVARETDLGWGAMPAFGESQDFAPRSAIADELLREAPHAARKSSLLGNFWAAVSQRHVHA